MNKFFIEKGPVSWRDMHHTSVPKLEILHCSNVTTTGSDTSNYKILVKIKIFNHLQAWLTCNPMYSAQAENRQLRSTIANLTAKLKDRDKQMALTNQRIEALLDLVSLPGTIR